MLRKNLTYQSLDGYYMYEIINIFINSDDGNSNVTFCIDGMSIFTQNSYNGLHKRDMKEVSANYITFPEGCSEKSYA